ncbi:tetratricopeptide repeat protein [Corallincola platygyrae]|uniref:Tetratricopeptide repeat protein n=1 Tax=Corallincola platygyrae TaxID=1193278 RepID=A0ABW4XU58_9GAMM
MRSVLPQQPQIARKLATDWLDSSDTSLSAEHKAGANLIIASSYIEEKLSPSLARKHLMFAREQLSTTFNPHLTAESHLISGRISAYFDNNVSLAVIEFDKGLELLNRATTPAPRLLKHALHEALGRAYNDQAKYSLASQHMLAALALTQKEDDPALKVWTRVYLAQSYKGLLQSQQAIKYLLAALAISDRAENKNLSAYIYGRLGLVYKQLSNFARAQDYIERAAELYQQLGDQSNLAHTLNFLGTVFEQQGLYDTALLHYLNALELTRKNPSPTKVGLLYHNIGQAYLHLKDYSNAQSYLDHALLELSQAENAHYLGASHLLMAKLQFQQRFNEQALFHANEALSLSSDGDYQYTPAEAHELLAQLYADKQDYEQAYRHKDNASRFKAPQQALLPPADNSEEFYQQQQLQRSIQNLRHQLEDTTDNLSSSQNWLRLAVVFGLLSVLSLIPLTQQLFKRSRQLNQVKGEQDKHPTTGLKGRKKLHGFLLESVRNSLKEHEQFYVDSSQPIEGYRQFYFLIEMPVMRQLYYSKGFNYGREFEERLGACLAQEETPELVIYHPRDYILCASLSMESHISEKQAIYRITSMLEHVFDQLELKEQQRIISIGAIAIPFLSKSARAIDGENLPELLLLALSGANQLRVIKGETAWVALHALDAAPGTLFNSNARTGCLLGLRKNLVKVLASHNKQLIEWPKD